MLLFCLSGVGFSFSSLTATSVGVFQTDEEESDSEQTKRELLAASSLDHTTTVDTSAQVIDNSNDKEEESDSNHPVPHLTESSIDAASTSPPVRVQ